ncbi:MAG: pentapeptide repeat-containing protein [Bacteroidota bacterium]
MVRKLRQAIKNLLSRWKASNRSRLFWGLMLALLIISNLWLFVRQAKLADTIDSLQAQQERNQDELVAALIKIRDYELIDELLASVEDEIKRSAQQQLSPETIARIAAYSQELAPVHPLVEDSIVPSPARGHLLTSLALMKMDTASFRQIREQVSFAGADLVNVNLAGKDLRKIDLRKANLPNAYLVGADLRGADLRGSRLLRAVLDSAKLDEAYLKRVDFRWASMIQTGLTYAQLDGAKLSNANLADANLYAATIEWADLSNASLVRANMQCVGFKGSDLRETNMQGAILDEAYLGRTDMSGTNLIAASLKEANMTGYSPINLSQVSVDDSLWLQKLSLWQVKGAETEAKKYIVQPNPSHLGTYYLESIPK